MSSLTQTHRRTSAPQPVQTVASTGCRASQKREERSLSLRMTDTEDIKMVIVLIKWKIRPKREDEFRQYWRQKAKFKIEQDLSESS